jgi:hypothetical protein
MQRPQQCSGVQSITARWLITEQKSTIKWYLLVQRLSPKLYPESRFRELVCLSKVGLSREAFQVCLAFDDPPPAGFENRRYDELRALVHRECENLSSCTSDNLLPVVNRSQNVAR